MFFFLFRTLGGLSLPALPSTSAPAPTPMDVSSSHPLSPTSTNPPSLFPETWLPMPMSQDFLRVPVSHEDRSYRTVYSLFHKTVSETKFRIIKIQRVQNPFLWEKYKRWGVVELSRRSFCVLRWESWMLACLHAWHLLKLWRKVLTRNWFFCCLPELIISSCVKLRGIKL